MSRGLLEGINTMEDLNSAGVEPYVAAAPLPKRSAVDELLFLLQQLITFIYMLVLTVPVWLNVIKYTLTSRPEKSIQGQLALVTGGGNGLGKAIALQLAKKKVNVAIADIDEAAAVRVAGDCKSFGVNAKAYKCNVGIFADIKKLSRDIEEDMGPVDILINNAGLMPAISFQEGKPEDIQRILDVNVTSHIWATRVFLPSMIRRGKGHIVAISSMSGISALGRAATYSASKFAVRGFMEALREELRLDGLSEKIHTSTIFPYFIVTRKDMIDHMRQTDYFDKCPPLLPEDVADSVVEAVVKNQVHVELPKLVSVTSSLIKMLPYEVQDIVKATIVQKNLPPIQEK